MIAAGFSGLCLQCMHAVYYISSLCMQYVYTSIECKDRPIVFLLTLRYELVLWLHSQDLIATKRLFTGTREYNTHTDNSYRIYTACIIIDLFVVHVDSAMITQVMGLS